MGIDAPIDARVDTSFDACEPVAETCDGTDEDCDGNVDEMVLTTFYVDADGDGQGDPERTCEACSSEECEPGLTWVELGEDCDDDCDVCSPDLTETCDELDNDCDESTDEEVTTTYYLDDDDDGFGDDDSTIEACALPEGYAEEGGDCADTDPNAFPGQTSHFQVEVVGPGGFDYNCDTEETYSLPIGEIRCEAGSCPGSPRWDEDMLPGCGMLGDTWHCLTFMGACQGDVIMTTGVTAACR